MSQADSRAKQLAILKQRKQLSVEEYLSGIRAGHKGTLSKAITLVESHKKAHHEFSREVIEASLPYTGNSVRIGITGVPGVGKSTFIEAFGEYVVNQGHKLAVLAIDPSSGVSKGSILGDKTRMEKLSTRPEVFIRPSPSQGSLGGVANATRESILLCEAAGYDVILVETVGVGQSETLVHSMVDFFLLLMLSGAGDELQGIKRGIMEMADTIVINKADGDNVRKAKMARREYANAIHLFPPAPSGWTPQVQICSSVENSGIKEVWDTIDSYVNHTKNNGYFDKLRSSQAKQHMLETVESFLRDSFFNSPGMNGLLQETTGLVEEGKVDAYTAAKKLVEAHNSLNRE